MISDGTDLGSCHLSKEMVSAARSHFRLKLANEGTGRNGVEVLQFRLPYSIGSVKLAVEIRSL
jgi:hypothetical protein